MLLQGDGECHVACPECGFAVNKRTVNIESGNSVEYKMATKCLRDAMHAVFGKFNKDKWQYYVDTVHFPLVEKGNYLWQEPREMGLCVWKEMGLPPAIYRDLTNCLSDTEFLYQYDVVPYQYTLPDYNQIYVDIYMSKYD